MSNPQTTVTAAPEIGMPGQIACNPGDAVVRSKFSEEASASLPFGVMLMAGTNDNGAKNFTANTGRCVGVTVFNQGFERTRQLDDNGIRPGVSVGLLEIGSIFVRVQDAVTPASQVHVRAVIGAGPGDVLGQFRGAKDGAETIDITAFARYKTSAGAGEIAEVEIDLTNQALQVADS